MYAYNLALTCCGIKNLMASWKHTLEAKIWDQQQLSSSIFAKVMAKTIKMVVSQPEIILPIRAPYKTYELQVGPCELKVDPYESNFGQYKAYAGV